MSLEGRHIAVIEDDPIMGESLGEGLRLEGARVTWWTNATDAMAGLRAARPDLVICDICLPDLSGEALFARLSPDTAAPFLFITAHTEIEQAVRLMRAGAGDYLAKPFKSAKLHERLAGLLQPVLAGDGRLGPSAAMRNIEAMLTRLAQRSTVFLLTGETGVGKEVCARFLHAATGRDGPFVSVDCASLASETLQAALEEASHPEHPGALFFDEVAELSDSLQPRLLRMMDELVLGSVGTVRHRGPAMIICSTNARLPDRIRERRFRADLYYRLNAIEVTVPALRERPEDIPWLLRRFAVEQAAAHDRPAPAITPLAELAALQHDWPGNVRELRNRVSRAAMLSTNTICRADLFPEDGPEEARPVASLGAAREMAERMQIEHVLARTRGNVLEAAELLGVSRSTLFDKMRRMKIVRD